MGILNVGGFNPFNRYDSLGEAIKVAEPDDTIMIRKNQSDGATVDKHLIIDGGNREIYVKPGEAGFIFNVPAIIKNLSFLVSSRANALVLNHGGILENVTVRFTNPAYELYPAVIHKKGTLKVFNSNLQGLSTAFDTYTEIRDSVLTDYYGGRYECLGDENASLLGGHVTILNSQVNSTVFQGVVTMTGSTVGQYNRVPIDGVLNLVDSKFTQLDLPKTFDERREPSYGPLSNSSTAHRYLLKNEGTLDVINYKLDSQGDFTGIFSLGGAVSISDTDNPNEGRHVVKNSSLMFKNVTDRSFYELESTAVSQVRSDVHTSQQIKSAMERLNTLIGLERVKHTVETIMNTIQLNQQTGSDDDSDFAFSYHMIFAGDPGTGKTMVGRIVAQALFEIGAIPENKVTFVTVDRLIKGYVGQTANNVREILDGALGGVLFIDEAYELSVIQGERSFNSEALSVLIRYMEDHRSDLVVIAAGYTEEMRQFLASNIGLSRRFQWVEFDDYSADELAAIFELMRTTHGKLFEDDGLSNLLPDLFGDLTDLYLNKPDRNGRITNGGNGGLVRNVYQQVIQAQTNRIISGASSAPNITRDDLIDGFEAEVEKAMTI